MKLIINLILVLLIGGLAYLLFSGIREPIKFNDEKNKRKDAVVSKLKQIRQAQELYREVTGTYAPTFDTLVQVLENENLKIISVFGDRDAVGSEEQEIRYDTTLVPAIDSVRSKGIDLATIADIPFTDGKQFEMDADTVTYQSTLVNVVQAGTRWKEFMGEYADPRFSKYDDRYEPNAMIKFGDMSAPNLSGNWE